MVSRMEERAAAIAERLGDLDNVTGVVELADRRLAEGDAAFAADLGIELWLRFASQSVRPWQYGAVLDHLVRLLCLTPGAANVEQALRLAAVAAGRKACREVASLLAAGQSPALLEVAFAGRGPEAEASEELRACLVHELVLRGAKLHRRPRIAEWATSPHWSEHPLHWLPLSKAAIEDRTPRPQYGVRGSSYHVPQAPAVGEAIVATGRNRPAPAAREITTEVTAAEMAAPMASWVQQSNGRVDARVYELAEPVDEDDVADLLLSLAWEPLQDAPAPFAVTPCTPATAWGLLFGAASVGGAYDWGQYGAYGRLAAWRSVGAFAGAGPGVSAAAVETSVQACSWYTFNPVGGWFYDVAWDTGLVAVTPDRRRLAVLAATDTD
jgi:hypothetical protein